MEKNDDEDKEWSKPVVRSAEWDSSWKVLKGIQSNSSECNTIDHIKKKIIII